MLVNVRAMAVPIAVTTTIEIRTTMATSRSEAFFKVGNSVGQSRHNRHLGIRTFGLKMILNILCAIIELTPRIPESAELIIVALIAPKPIKEIH